MGRNYIENNGKKITVCANDGDCVTRYQDILETVKSNGLRLTPQRLIILSAIAEGEGHMNVDEVYRRAKLAYPYMDIATVYRTLHLFKKLRLVTEVGMGDRLALRADRPRCQAPPHGVPEMREGLQPQPQLPRRVPHQAFQRVRSSSLTWTTSPSPGSARPASLPKMARANRPRPLPTGPAVIDCLRVYSAH